MRILREIMRVREELDPDKYFVLLDRPAAIRQLKERMEQLFLVNMKRKRHHRSLRMKRYRIR